jgi:hypothetical protein
MQVGRQSRRPLSGAIGKTFAGNLRTFTPGDVVLGKLTYRAVAGKLTVPEDASCAVCHAPATTTSLIKCTTMRNVGKSHAACPN